MSQLESASRCYDALVPRSQLAKYAGREYLPPILASPIRDWLITSVLPAISPLIANGGFRLHARWPLSFCEEEGEDSEERRLVREVDTALVACATALMAFRRKRSIINRIELTSHQLKDLEMLRSRCDAMPGRPWEDLASPLDYFEPWADRVRFRESFRESPIELRNTPLTQTGACVIGPDITVPHRESSTTVPAPNLGHWLPAFKAELHDVGAVLLQSMLYRIELHRKDLRGLRNLYRRHHTEFPQFRDDYVAEADAWRSLDEAVVALRGRALTSEFAQAADAACVAVQLKNALEGSNELGWLELPDQVFEGAAVSLSGIISNRLKAETAERIAGAVGVLARHFSEDRVSLHQAIATGGLVILDSSRRLWWHRREITPEAPTRDTAWRLLRLLAKRAKRRQPTTKHDLYELGTTKTDQTFRMQKSKLEPVFRMCRDLDIESDQNKGYLLSLGNADVYLFEHESHLERRV